MVTKTHTHTHTQQNCKNCGYYPNENGKRSCDKCIRRHRPKMSTGWLIFWFFFTSGIGALIYYFWKKNKQEEWDHQNL